MEGWKTSLLLLLLLVQRVPGEELPGHMKPLGAHRPPEQVRRLSHLPGPKQFYEEFMVPKTPVIFEGAMRNSPVWRSWQDDAYIRLARPRGWGT